MKTNMGKIDRFVRIVLAVLITILYSANILTGALGVILLIVAFAFVATSFIGFCPLYTPFGLSTIRKKTTKTT
ncbi:MAG TPA: DUF2892 domain-containing protein [Chryseosolibacter sp.]